MSSIENLPAINGRKFALVTAPLDHPTAVLQQCEQINGGGVEIAAKYLPKAIELAEIMPPAEAIYVARQQIARAATAPMSEAECDAMVAAMLDGSGQAMKDEAYFASLLGAVRDASDPMARSLDLWPTIPVPVSPIVLHMAIRTLGNTKTFRPERAEMLAACVRCYRKLATMERKLAHYEQTREQVDEVLRLFGPPPRRVAACRVRADVIKTNGRARP